MSLKLRCLAYLMMAASVWQAGAAVLPADEEYVVRQWQTTDGLPQNTVSAIAQTPDGYLWLGTFNGLVRFDGVRFKVFTGLNTPEMQSDYITALLVDRTGQLWISTDGGGITVMSGGNFRRLPAGKEPEERDILHMRLDPQGKVWLCSMRSVYAEDGEGFKKVADAMPDYFPFRGIAFTGRMGQAETASREVRVWVATRLGLYELKEGKLVAASRPGETARPAASPAGTVWYYSTAAGLMRLENGKEESVIHMERWPEVMVFDGTGALWVGGNGNKLRFLEKESWYEFQRIPVLVEHDLTAIYPDHEGNVWIGVDGGGLVRLRKKSVQVVTAPGMNLQNAVTITQDNSGRIWSGRIGSKFGLDWIDPEDLSVSRGPQEFTGMWPSSVYTGKDGSVWIGTFGRGLWRWKENQLSFQWESRTPWTGTTGNVVRVLFEDSRGGFWIGTDSRGAELFEEGKLRRFTKKQGLANDRVTAICEGADGAIWLGTGGGMSRLTRREKEWNIENFGKDAGLGADRVHCVMVGSKGVLWVGTAGGGLSRWEGNRFITMRARHGIIDNVIGQVIEDDEGNIWIGTNRGIARLQRKELEDFAAGRADYVHPLVFSAAEGMPQEECGGGFQPACLKDQKGRLWFSTVGGVVVLNPGELPEAGTPPRVYIEEVVIDGGDPEVYAGGTGVEVPRGTTTLEVRFTAIDFGGPEKISFQYQLEGYDEKWISAGGRRRAFYTKVPPGEYRFLVRAANHQGTWSMEPALARMSVLPEWWQTTSAKAAGCAAGIGLLGASYTWRTRKQRRQRTQREEQARKLIESQERERQRVSRELHDSLGQSLLVIKNRAFVALQDANGEPGIRRHLEEICNASGEAVQEVRQISQALRPLQLERLGLTRTIEGLIKQAGEAGDFAVEVSIRDIDQCLPEHDEIHFLRIVQECLNNILKHSKASSIRVEIKPEGEMLDVFIADDGCGFDLHSQRSKKSGLGLTVLSERVNILGGQLSVQSEIAQGTKITIRIPRSRRG